MPGAARGDEGSRRDVRNRPAESRRDDDRGDDADERRDPPARGERRGSGGSSGDFLVAGFPAAGLARAALADLADSDRE